MNASNCSFTNVERSSDPDALSSQSTKAVSRLSVTRVLGLPALRPAFSLFPPLAIYRHLADTGETLDRDQSIFNQLKQSAGQLNRANRPILKLNQYSVGAYLIDGKTLLSEFVGDKLRMHLIGSFARLIQSYEIYNALSIGSESK